MGVEELLRSKREEILYAALRHGARNLRVLLVLLPMRPRACRLPAGGGAGCSGDRGQLQAAPAAPVAPLSSQGTPDGAAAAPRAGPAQEAGIHFEVPAGWRAPDPQLQHALAQATFPGPGGPGVRRVLLRAGQGGAVEANSASLGGPGGGRHAPARQLREPGLKVTWIDMAGTLQPTSMGVASSTRSPTRACWARWSRGRRSLVLQGHRPRLTLGPQRDAFVRMLKSVRPRASAPTGLPSPPARRR